MKKIFYLACCFMLFTSCKDENATIGINPNDHSGGDVTVSITAGTEIKLQTDKACYAPGESVTFTADGQVPAGAKIRYRQLGEVVAEQDYTGNSWSWTLPEKDFTGYMVEIYSSSNDTAFPAIRVRGRLRAEVGRNYPGGNGLPEPLSHQRRAVPGLAQQAPLAARKQS